MEQRGEITDDDRRVAAERSGLPEAAVHGVSTFYDDLLQPRGARHVRVCTGTACFAATGDAHVDALRDGLGGGLALGERSADGAVSLAETVCLGFCHASPAIRDGDVDRRRARRRRARAGRRARPAAEPRAAQRPARRAAAARDRPRLGGPARARSPTMTPEELLAQVTEAEVRGRGGAGFPAGSKWAFARAAPGERKFIVANGDEGDPGSYIDKVLMEAWPNLLVEGMALAGYAVGADHGFVLTRSEYPRSKPALEAAVAQAHRDGHLGARHPRQRLRVRRHDRRGRGLLRRRRGDGAARLPAGAARHGLGAAAVSRPARAARPADRRQQRRDAVQHPARGARGRGGLPRAEPGQPDLGHEARLLQRALRAARRLRGRVRHAGARAVRGRRRRPGRRPRDQGAADRRAAGRDPARVAARHAV